MVIVDQILADLFYINNATKFWQEPQPHWWNAAPNNDRASSMILIHLKFGFMTTKDNLTLIFSPVLPTLIPQHFILVFLSNKCLLTVNIRWFNWSAKHISQFLCQSFAWFFSCFLWTWLEIWFICIRWFHTLLLLLFNLSSFLWFFFCQNMPTFQKIAIWEASCWRFLKKSANTKVTKETIFLSFLLSTQQFFNAWMSQLKQSNNKIKQKTTKTLWKWVKNQPMFHRKTLKEIRTGSRVLHSNIATMSTWQKHVS